MSGRLRARLRRGSLVGSQLSTAAAALLIAAILLLVFEVAVVRNEVIGDLRAHARGVAVGTAPALVFDDHVAVVETLMVLETLKAFQAAAIYDVAGARVAVHRHADSPAIELPDRLSSPPGHWMDLRSLHVVEPIWFGEERIGSVLVRASLERLYMRVLLFAAALVAVCLGALAISYPRISRMSARMKLAEQRLDQLAHFDPVTGLPNRNAFNAHLARLLAEAWRSGQSTALLMLDVDNFKLVNDSLGHQFGDRLLRQIAARLTRSLRSEDRVFRIGGDEFAVLLYPVDGLIQAEQAAQRILGQVQQGFLLERQDLHAALSCGISLFPDQADSAQVLMSNADTAMYAAKRSGKNQFATFRPQMTVANQLRMRLGNDLRHAIARGELRLEFQPQAACKSSAITGMEALLRWDHPQLGQIQPREFISIAEEGGLILELGSWAIRQACQQVVHWQSQGLQPVRVAINVSTRQVRDPGLWSLIDQALQATGCPAELLELEITESLLMEEVEANIAVLRQLRQRGIHLSIDDFGTGYSSMAYLQRLPVDRLKIDMSFIRNIPGDGEVITSAIIALAHRLGIDVVAEGVETEAQLQFLKAAACDTIQGYWLAHPLPAAQAQRWLRPARPRRPGKPRRSPLPPDPVGTRDQRRIDRSGRPDRER